MSPVIEDEADGLLDLRRTSWTLRSGMTMRRRGVGDGPPLYDYTFFRILHLSHIFAGPSSFPAIGEQK